MVPTGPYLGLIVIGKTGAVDQPMARQEPRFLLPPLLTWHHGQPITSTWVPGYIAPFKPRDSLLL